MSRRAILLLLILAGCSQKHGLRKTPSKQEETPIRRIVSLTPALTETLFLLGYGDHVVGVSEFSTFPPEANTLPKVGGPDEKRMNVEAIVALKPDLVFADRGFQQGLIDRLKALGILVETRDVNSTGEVRDLMNACVLRLGSNPTSQKRIDDFLRDMTKYAKGRYANPPTVFYHFGDPLFTAGGTSFTNEIIERAGGKNLFADVMQKSPQISEEELIRRNPDVIVVSRMTNDKISPEARKAELLAKPSWRTLNAVKNKRIIFLDEDAALRPGPRLFDAVRELEAALHPNAKP